MVPVIFSGFSLNALLFVLISVNDESEFYTNLLKNLITDQQLVNVKKKDSYGLHR
jgi:hypothetical protein